jgi:hypothetical protein
MMHLRLAGYLVLVSDRPPQSSEADEAARQPEERFVHVGAVVAGEKRLELVQLSEGALDVAAKAAELGAALGLAGSS